MSLWHSGDKERAADYARRFEELAAVGNDMHGEAHLLDALLGRASTILDAGCGTGRVAIRLDALGHRVVGVDADDAMLDQARLRAPQLPWIHGDLADLPAQVVASARYDAVIAAGNVMIFLAPGTLAAVLQQISSVLVSGGLLLAGFSIGPSTRPPGSAPVALTDYDAAAEGAGLHLVQRWATWDRVPFSGADNPGTAQPGDYAVSLHTLARVTAHPRP